MRARFVVLSRPPVILAAGVALLWMLALTAISALPLYAHAGVGAIAHAQSVQQVTVYDPDNVLSDQEEARLVEGTRALEFATDVPHVDYIVSATATEPYDDWIKDFGLQSHRELINAEGNKFADGHVMFTVDTNLRRMGTYVGEDLKEPLGYLKHANEYSDSMQEDFRNGDWVGGLLTGASTVADYDQSDDEFGADDWAIVGGIGALAVAATGGVATKVRRSKRKKARDNYEVVARNYGRLAGELDSIDVRAHSLSSPIADAALRREWEEIRDGFLAHHDAMMALPEKADDKAIYARRKEFAEAAASVTSLKNAEANIETIFQMENGNTDTRLKELLTLHEDLLKAQVEAQDPTIAARISTLADRCQALMKNLSSPTLMDEYSMIVSEFSTLGRALAKKQLTKANLDTHRAPGLASSGWHPGYGYNNYVPYVMISTWHNDAVSAASSSSSSSASFSGGFSGSGSSGSF